MVLAIVVFLAQLLTGRRSVWGRLPHAAPDQGGARSGRVRGPALLAVRAGFGPPISTPPIRPTLAQASSLSDRRARDRFVHAV